MPRVSGTRAQPRVAVSDRASGYVAGLAWAPDGQSVAVADDAGGVGVIAVDGGDLLPVCEHPGGALTVAWSTRGVLASGGRDGRVLLDGGAIAAADQDTARRPWIERLTWRPDGALLAAAAGRRVELWTPEGARQDVSDPLPATVACLAWHPRGVLLAAGTYGGVRLLRRTGAVDKHLKWTGSVLELAFSPDGRRLAHGNQDASVHFWDLRKGTELEMSGYATKVRELGWSDNGRWLATGGGDELTLWDFHRAGGPQGSRPLQLDHDERVVALAFQPGGDLLAGADRGGMVLIWRPGEDDLPVGGTALDEPATTIAWSPDGRHLAVGGADGSILVLGVEVEHGAPTRQRA
jgi:WD40 repeat protein